MTIRLVPLKAAAGIGAVVLTVILGLTGCTGSGYPVLDRAAEPGDALPAGLPDSASDNLDPSSIRFAGLYRGDRLYIAKGEARASYGGESVCLLIYPEETKQWFVGCGHGGIGLDGGDRKYELHVDIAPLPDGAVKVSPNIFVIE